MVYRMVSIRAPAWGATRSRKSPRSSARFQFALPRGERRAVASVTPLAVTFQFALPRGERRRLLMRTGRFSGFQFALPRGERPGAAARCETGRSFNSRSRVGSDIMGSGGARRTSVSIRAPAWGATKVLNKTIASFAFQFALPRGERPLCRAGCRGMAGFNSRSRVGSDAAHRHRRRHRLGFNSRSRVGSDPPFVGAHRQAAVSIRAPAWGATSISVFIRATSGFQFALPRGERPSAAMRAEMASSFQFALPRGERPYCAR